MTHTWKPETVYESADRELINHYLVRSDTNVEANYIKTEANARLIAASPRMIKALEALVDLHDADGYGTKAFALAVEELINRDVRPIIYSVKGEEVAA